MIERITRKVLSIWKFLIDEYLSRLCYRSRFLSDLYYLLFSRTFSREHQAVLTGKVKHLNQARRLKANYFLLVRNTHRLEKGLLMRPRRPVFAKNFIAETIDSFAGVWQQDNKGPNPQLKWFHDVLHEYFEQSGEDTLVTAQGKKFRGIVNAEAVGSCDAKAIPYFRNTDDRSNICYEEFFKLTRQRRSVRWYADAPVPRELIDKAVLAANQSPSACNRQPFEFRIFDDPQLVEQVVDLPMGTQGYGHAVPVIAVVVGHLDAYFDERDRHLIYIDGALASMSFMLALETLGLSSCPINWPDIESREKRMKQLLSLQPHQRPIMCIALGYPDPSGMVAFSEKRTVDQVRTYNRETYGY